MSAADVATRASLSDRVLIVVQGSRNGKVTLDLLLGAGLDAYVCSNVDELCAEIERGGAAALIDSVAGWTLGRGERGRHDERDGDKERDPRGHGRDSTNR